MTEQKDIVLLEKLGEMKSKFLQEISKSVIGQQDVLNHILIGKIHLILIVNLIHVIIWELVISYHMNYMEII